MVILKFIPSFSSQLFFQVREVRNPSIFHEFDDVNPVLTVYLFVFLHEKVGYNRRFVLRKLVRNRFRSARFFTLLSKRVRNDFPADPELFKNFLEGNTDELGVGGGVDDLGAAIVPEVQRRAGHRRFCHKGGA